jgi:hypothetical protein
VLAYFQGVPELGPVLAERLFAMVLLSFFSILLFSNIITALSKHRSLLVVARNSTFALKGHGGDIRRIVRDLGVNYIVQGRVRRIGPRVRQAQLVEQADNKFGNSTTVSFRTYLVQDEIGGRRADRTGDQECRTGSGGEKSPNVDA